MIGFLVLFYKFAYKIQKTILNNSCNYLKIIILVIKIKFISYFNSKSDGLNHLNNYPYCSLFNVYTCIINRD